VTAAGRDGDDALVGELQDYVKTNAVSYMYPRVISFERELPKTINEKILRSEIRERK
jgi:acyl-coenzyme A synthetase/AMP-(fatty) acid ligase